MIESFYADAAVCAGLREGPLGPFMEPLAAILTKEGYSRDHGRRGLRVAQAFGKWLAKEDIPLTDAALHTDRFFCEIGKRPRLSRSLEFLLQILRDQGVLRAEARLSSSKPDWLVDYEDYLQRVAAVAPGTQTIYVRVAKRLVDARYGNGVPEWSALDAEEVAGFVMQQTTQNGGTPRRGVATATRAFLRSLVFSGKIAPGLLGSVPSVREWRLASLPKHLSPGDAARVLGSVNERSVTALRDRAILKILARLGLRAGEVAQLDLEDIDWRGARLLVRPTKTLRERSLPLPQDVGTAIVRYLKSGRPRVLERALFLRGTAPRRRLTSSAVTGIVVRHLRRANVRAGRMGAHALRHTVATEMVRHGATFKEVADVLGHQSLRTTQVYAKLDMPALSGVALPWPGGTQ